MNTGHTLLRHDYGRVHNDTFLYNGIHGHDVHVRHVHDYVHHDGRHARDDVRGGRGGARVLHHVHGGGIHNLDCHNARGRGVRDDGDDVRAYAQ